MIPPFETFYATHRDEVFRYLAGRLGRERAEDAFQETFLRALRAYDRLEYPDHLRAWILTIASRIVIDDVLPPWRPRMIEVRGTAAVIPSGGKAFGERFEDTVVRIRPTRIISIGIDSTDTANARSVASA